MKERYTKTKWVDGKTCVNAANLNKIESGIENLYRNAVGESQLQEGDGISLNKDPMTGNITIGIKAENDLVSSSAVGRIEVVESMPANPDPNCMYFVKDLDTGKFDLVFGGINLLSTISSADVPLAKLEGEVEVVDNGDGTFSVSYDGEEGIPEIVVYFNGVPREDPEDFVLVPGVNTFEVHVRIDGYEEIVEEYEIEYTPKTANPTLSYDPETYTVTVSGEGEIRFYIDEELTELGEEGTYTFVRGSEEIQHTLSVIAQKENCEESDKISLTVTIPALPNLTGEITIIETPKYSGILSIKYSGENIPYLLTAEGDFTLITLTRSYSDTFTPNNGLDIQLNGEAGKICPLDIKVEAEGYLPLTQHIDYEWRGKRSNPIITFTENEETGDLEVQVTNSTSASITINGVGDILGGSCTVSKTYENQDIIVIAQNITDSSTPYLDSSDRVQEEYTLTAKEKTPSEPAEFNFWLDEDGTKAYFTATGSSVKLYVNGINEEISTTQEFNRPGVGEKDMIIPAHTYYAGTLQQGEQYKETITRYEEDIIIPAQIYSDPVIAETAEEDKTYTVDFVGSSIKKAYLDITEIELPYVVNKIETKQTLTFRIITKEDYKIEKEYILTVEIPALTKTMYVVGGPGDWSLTDPLSSLTNTDGGEIYVGTLNVNSYITFALADGTPEDWNNDWEIFNTTYRYSSNQPNQPIYQNGDTVIVEKPGEGNYAFWGNGEYRLVFDKENSTLRIETINELPKTRAANPVINWDPETYTVSAECSGYNNEDIIIIRHDTESPYNQGSINNPYTFQQTNEQQSYYFTAVNHGRYWEEWSDEVRSETYIIPALIQKTNTPTITQNGLTVTATGDGNILLYVDGVLINGSTTYTFTKTDEQTEHTVTATAQEDGKEISEVASLTITVPALVYAEEPTFNWAAQSNTMSATCRDHNVVLKLNGEEVENPYQIEPEEEELVLNFSAYTIANEGEDRNSAEKEYEGNPITIPALDPYVEPEEPTVDPELTGQIAYNGPDETGKINITYSGEEDVTFTVILNGQPAILGENNELQLQEGINNIGVRVEASGYSDKSATFTINWPE